MMMIISDDDDVLSSLESVLSRTPVPLHGTQCPNTSVLNLTLVLVSWPVRDLTDRELVCRRIV